MVFDLPDAGRVGLGICYDIWYPGGRAPAGVAGRGSLLFPAQTSTCDRAQELVMARAAAIANQTFVVSLNAAAPVGTGRSIVVDPEGLVRTQAPSEAPAVLTDVIDLDEVGRVRTYGTCGLNRLWSQFRSDDAVLDLPAYGGSIDPQTWEPGSALAKEKLDV